MSVPSDPGDFSAHTTADAVAVNNRFHPLYNVLNAGLDDTNMSKPLEPAFSVFRPIIERKSVSLAGPGSGTYALVDCATALSAGGAYANSAFYFDPARWTAGSRTTKLQVAGHVTPNTVNPGVNFTFGLYPVGSTGGGTSAAPTIASFGTVVSGSQAAITTPTGQAQNVSGAFTAPASGYYFLGVLLSGNASAQSVMAYRCELQVQQV